jgi:hypothetical protein
MMVSDRLNNATTTGDQLTREPVDIDLARFDRFPFVLRRRVDANNTKASTAAIEPHLAWAMRTGCGVGATISRIDEIERNEIAVFAGEYFAATGCRYPHTAAEASIQRYGALGESRHPPRRYGRPVFQRQHPKRRRRWN